MYLCAIEDGLHPLESFHCGSNDLDCIVMPLFLTDCSWYLLLDILGALELTNSLNDKCTQVFFTLYSA